MTREEKAAVIEELKEKFRTNSFFYVADSSTLTVEQINRLRGMLFEKGVEMKVVKNKLAIKALEEDIEEKGYGPLLDVFKGPSAVLFSEVANVPAKVIKEFRESSDRPILKGAYIDSAVYVGDDQLDALTKLKSKEDLLAELIGLLKSPMSNLMGALNSGSNNLTGILKALEERGE